jgi:hypothetical protein
MKITWFFRNSHVSHLERPHGEMWCFMNVREWIWHARSTVRSLWDALLIMPIWYLQHGNFAERSLIQRNPALRFRKNYIEITNFSLWLARLLCVIRRLRNAITLRNQVRWLRFPPFPQDSCWKRSVRSVTPGLFMSSFWIKNHNVWVLDAEIRW